MMLDPYGVLETHKKATPDEIKRAYHKLAKKYHPDISPGNPQHEKKFRDIAAAYDLLSDPEKRARFDRGEIDAHAQEQGPSAFYRAYQKHQQQKSADAGFHFSDILRGASNTQSDIFSQLFGARPKTRAHGASHTAGEPPHTDNHDQSYTLRIGFIEAALGAKRRLTLSCGKSVDVVIPPGTVEGKILRLKKQGVRHPVTGLRGDALIEIHIEPHPHMTRQAQDIYLDVPLGLKEAVLGAKIQIPTIHGPVMVVVPPGTQSGTTMRLKGKGIIQPHLTPGDQFLIFHIRVENPTDHGLIAFLSQWDAPQPHDRFA